MPTPAIYIWISPCRALRAIRVAAGPMCMAVQLWHALTRHVPHTRTRVWGGMIPWHQLHALSVFHLNVFSPCRPLQSNLLASSWRPGAGPSILANSSKESSPAGYLSKDKVPNTGVKHQLRGCAVTTIACHTSRAYSKQSFRLIESEVSD